MSISRIGLISTVSFLFPIVTQAQSDGSVWTILPSNSEDTQVVNLTLSETDIRRLSYYSTQTLAAIYELGSATADPDASIENLRQKVARLVDAGTRCGYNTEQTAEFFGSFVEENLAGALPTALEGPDGKLEALQLLVSVEAFYAQSQPDPVDVAAVMAEDLEGIKSVAISTSPLQSETDSMQLSVTVLPDDAAETLQGPAIPENADAATRAVLARIYVSGDEWVIEVRQGDSLAQIAYALFQDRLRFNEIYNLNRGVLRSPNVLSIGQILVLPRNG